MVLGKRKAKLFSLMGDPFTYVVLKHHTGVITIADDKHTLEPNKELTLGKLNTIASSIILDFGKGLMGYAKKTIQLFKRITNSNAVKRTSKSSDKKTIEYLIAQEAISIENLSKINTNL